MSTEVAPSPPSPTTSGRAVVKDSLTRENAPPSSLLAMHAMNATVDDLPLPRDTVRSDIRVAVIVSLESSSNKENAHIQELAEQVRSTIEGKLRKWYTGTEGQARFLLKVYVTAVDDGTAVNGLSFGLLGREVQEGLEWFLQSEDGATTYKAGRVGDHTSAVFGRDRLLTKRFADHLVKTIVSKIGIANHSASLKCCA